MRTLNRCIVTLSLSLAAAVAVPTLFVAKASAQVGLQVRVYDRNHRDYHNWDDHEDHAYRRYLNEQHRGYRDYNHQSHKVQGRYWNWRHDHPERG